MVPTVAETLAAADPPAPAQLSVNVVVDASALLDSLPLVALEPVQPPDAVHRSALLAVQFKDVRWPDDTVVG